MSSEFLSQTELGVPFGVSCQVIGRWLVEIGLRKGGQPTAKAIAGGYCSSRSTGRGPHPRPFTVWHGEKTIAAFERAGHFRIGLGPTPPEPADHKLTGPFTIHQDGNGYRVIGGDGTGSIWVYGEATVRLLVKLMNMAHQYGYFK
jgi:hypothetical protein